MNNELNSRLEDLNKDELINLIDNIYTYVSREHSQSIVSYIFEEIEIININKEGK